MKPRAIRRNDRNSRITKHGFIRGGLCEKRLIARKFRSDGAGLAWYFALKQKGCVTINKGWYKMLKVPKFKGIGQYGNGDVEIGVLRMHQSTFTTLIKSGKSFRLKWMEMWIEGMASAEFGIHSETPLSILNEGITTGLIPPNPSDDAIYEKIHGVQRGILKSNQ